MLAFTPPAHTYEHKKPYWSGTTGTLFSVAPTVLSENLCMGHAVLW